MDVKSLPQSVRAYLRNGFTISTITQCVTELVLNSLDAKSTAIAVRINLLAFRVQIVDNGKGVTRTNMNVVGTRYMTDKCRSLTDLKNIKSFGFRGEALASICGMSKKVTIISRSNDSEDTYQKLYINSKWNSVELVKQRFSRGTTITIEDFMCNFPVRQKRINKKLDLDEIKRNLEILAVIHPNVSFNLRNDATGKITLHCNKTPTVSHALNALYHEIEVDDLMEFKVTKGKTCISGLICKKTSIHNKLQLIYINRRPVTSPQIQKLMKSLLIKSLILSTSDIAKHPVYMLNVRCPYSDVDLILNFSKTTVEFKNWNVILKCIEKVVTKLLENEELLIKKPNQTINNDKNCALGINKFQSQFGISQLEGVVKSIAVKRKQDALKNGNQNECDIIIENDNANKSGPGNNKNTLDDAPVKKTKTASYVRTTKFENLPKAKKVKDNDIPPTKNPKRSFFGTTIYDDFTVNHSNLHVTAKKVKKGPFKKPVSKPVKNVKRKRQKRKNLLTETSDSDINDKIPKHKEIKYKMLPINNTKPNRKKITKRRLPLNNLVAKLPAKNIFERHTNTQSLVLNSEMKISNYNPAELDLLNSTLNTVNLNNQEKGKNTIMETFLRSTVAFPNKEYDGFDNKTVKTIIIETTDKNLFTKNGSNKTVMTTSMKITSRNVTVARNSICPGANIEKNRLSKQMMVSKFVQTTLTEKSTKGFVNFFNYDEFSQNHNITFTKYFENPIKYGSKPFGCSKCNTHVTNRKHSANINLWREMKNAHETFIPKLNLMKPTFLFNNFQNQNLKNPRFRFNFCNQNITSEPCIQFNSWNNPYKYAVNDIWQNSKELNMKLQRFDVQKPCRNFHKKRCCNSHRDSNTILENNTFLRDLSPNTNKYTKCKRKLGNIEHQDDRKLITENLYESIMRDYPEVNFSIFKNSNYDQRHQMRISKRGFRKTKESVNAIEGIVCSPYFHRNLRNREFQNKNRIINGIANNECYSPYFKANITGERPKNCSPYFSAQLRNYNLNRFKNEDIISNYLIRSPYFKIDKPVNKLKIRPNTESSRINRRIPDEKPPDFFHTYNFFNKNLNSLPQQNVQSKENLYRTPEKVPLNTENITFDTNKSHSNNIRSEMSQALPSLQMPFSATIFENNNPFKEQETYQNQLVQRSSSPKETPEKSITLGITFNSDLAQPYEYNKKIEFQFAIPHRLDIETRNCNINKTPTAQSDLSIPYENFLPAQCSSQIVLANDSVNQNSIILFDDVENDDDVIHGTPPNSDYRPLRNLGHSFLNFHNKIETNGDLNFISPPLFDIKTAQPVENISKFNTSKKKNSLKFNFNFNNQIIEQQNINDTDQEKSWTYINDELDNKLYIHKRTGMVSKFSPKQDSHFDFIKRYEFVPKGLSPILAEKGIVEVPLSPTSKRFLHQTILQNYEAELNTIKWSKYIQNCPDKDINKFFEELYQIKAKQYEKCIPNISVNELPKSMIKLCRNIQAQSFTHDIFDNLRIIGQWDKKFVIAQSEKQNLLVLFDQHAMHERIRLENLLNEYAEYNNDELIKIKCTRIREEILMTLPEDNLNALRSFQHTFNNLGLFYECFRNGIKITHIPICFKKKLEKNNKDGNQVNGLITQLICEEMKIIDETRGASINVPTIIHNIINSEACRGSVKFGDKLTHDDCVKYIIQIASCKLPFQCAHGRPSLIPLIDLKPNLNVEKSVINLKKLKSKF